MARIVETKSRVSIYATYHLIPLTVIMAGAAVLSFFGFLPFPNDFVTLVFGFIFTAAPTLLMLALMRINKYYSHNGSRYLVLSVAIIEIAVLNATFTLFAFPLFILPIILALYYQSRSLIRQVGLTSIMCGAVSIVIAYRFKLGSFAIDSDLEAVIIDYRQIIGISVLEIMLFLYIAFSTYYVTKYLVRISNYQKSMANTVAKDEQFGVYNKFQFQIELKNIIANNPSVGYSIVVTDIEKFSVFNDLFDHDKGDVLLKTIANHLNEYCAPDGITGRLGDDHLVCLIANSRFDEQKFVDTFFHNSNLSGSANYPVTVICGVYEINDRRVASDVMLDRVLMAVHSEKAKLDGIAYYRDSMLFDARRNNEFLAELNDALNDNQFEPYLQPQFDAAGKVTGAEVLVRWLSPTRGMVPPDEFITACEEHGYISRLDKDMWVKACAILADWKKREYNDLYLSVNVSKVDMFDLDILDVMTGLAKKYDISPSSLHLEITETSMMKEFEKAKDIIRSLRAAGFIVEIDDFGSGYSSLGMLSEIEVDAIKVDSTFVRRLDREKHAKVIMRIIAKMVKDIGTHSIVEGVENEEQLEFLKNVGFEKFQGFYFSKAIPQNDFERKYITNE